MSIISEKQHQANRQNAKNSTGPKTTEGKQAIRFNALTFGLRTRATLLPDENAADYSRLWDEMEAQWQPQDRTERCYLETMVTSQWLLARVAESEKKVYMFVAFGEKQFKMLAQVSKQRAQLERSFRTAVQDMKQSQRERRQQNAQRPEAPAQAAQPPVHKPAEPQTPSPGYVMSEAPDAPPVFCSPATPESR